MTGAREDLQPRARHCRVRGVDVADGDDRVAISPDELNREERPERSAVLLGAADELFKAIGGRAPDLTSLATLHEKSWQNARTSLGDKAFESSIQRGAALSADEAVAYALGERPRTEAPAASGANSALTRREQQVAELVAEGLSNRAIADRLVISQRTVEGHVEHALVKLGFTSRTQLAAWVHEQKPDR
ncbi:helix-turn-helix transcriptional regulator [Rhodococcus sp. WAY2]|uniref:helix-turn-helix transcriptional regulator n=1 Tax=Rhodococcus sp. WAY2 TaxID=2663121 RepID=UPI002E2C9E6E|nr:helix-turn-helix transcriptional regulator [Rhodococcus sp. WAY2]